MMILSLTLFILSIFIISSILMIPSSFLSKKKKKKMLMTEKNSPFECGFDPKGSARMLFSLRFFLIAVIFLIFDVEITLLLPLVPIINLSIIKSWVITGIFFLLILLVGLYHEWAQGALDWAE